ncbi:MAG: efflux RND transporter periplasmic adaptor subunit [Planctomycetia bacterium]|nr:efflux RND transporter periplasmic adaptor subunit [Planctomycetia bacterium]
MTLPQKFFQKNLKFLLTATIIIIAILYFSVETAKHQRKHHANVDTGTENEFLRIPVVKTIEVQPQTSPEERSFTGFAKEGKTSRIGFRVNGPIIRMNAVIGKRVSQGTVLAEIDPRDFELAVARVKTSLDEAEATLKTMTAGARAEDLASLEAQLRAATSAYETAEVNLRRFESLLADKTTSQAQYDQVKLQYETAKSAKETAQQQLEKGKKGARDEEIEVVKAKIAGLKVTLQTAENALADTKLLAPYHGYVSQKFVETDEFVVPGAPVVAFTEAQTIHVETAIPEAMMIRQNEMSGFSCTFEAYPERRFTAELNELGQALQAGKQGYPLEITVNVPDDVLIHPGMAATVFIELQRKNPPCFVPLSAIVGVENLSALTPKEMSGEIKSSDSAPTETVVWTINPKDSTIQKRTVQIIRVLDDGVEINGEIKPGEKIVGAGARFLTEGQKVRFK